MSIDFERLERRIEFLAELGRGPGGGITRLAFSDEDKAARKQFMDWAAEDGLRCRVDAAGNIIVRYGEEKRGIPVVMTGSHLDTVPDGGIYDGVYGCLAGLECVASFKREELRLKRPVEVVVFADEEGCRFGRGLLGSKAMAGLIDEHTLVDAKDADGVRRSESMKLWGLDLSSIAKAARRREEIAAFLELHVEQGAVLDSKSCRAGVVEQIVGTRRYRIDITGQANHAGTTPIGLRKDALVAASRFVGQAPHTAIKVGGEYTVATVGTIHVPGGAVNVVPGRVEMSLEIRDAEERVLGELERSLKELLGEVTAQDGLSFEMKMIYNTPPVPMSVELAGVISAVCEEQDVPWMYMPSGAGHDAQAMAQVFPTGMLFVPSVGGLSHCPREFSRNGDLKAGAELLYAALRRLAG